MISDEWTTGNALLLAWIAFMAAAVHLIERRPQLRYSFARAGIVLASIAAFWAVLLALGVPL